MMMTKWTAKKLIEICEQSVVPVSKWSNRDSPEAQKQIGEAWVYLKSGCKFRIRDDMGGGEGTIWVEITHPNFGTFDWDGGEEEETFYLPTPERLASRSGGDWY